MHHSQVSAQQRCVFTGSGRWYLAVVPSIKAHQRLHGFHSYTFLCQEALFMKAL